MAGAGVVLAMEDYMDTDMVVDGVATVGEDMDGAAMDTDTTAATMTTGTTHGRITHPTTDLVTTPYPQVAIQLIIMYNTL
jgi:hypothetical protein